MVTTITTTAAEDQRISVAFGTYLALGHNANATEVKQAMTKWMTDIVKNQEELAQIVAIVPNPPIAPT